MSKWVKYYFVRLKHDVYTYLIKGLYVTQRHLLCAQASQTLESIIGDVIPDLIFLCLLVSHVLCVPVCEREVLVLIVFFNLKYLAILVFSLKRILLF